MASKAMSPARNNLSDPRHLLRFLKSQAGMTPEEIAKAEHVSAKVVQDSIRRVENHRRLSTQGEMEIAIRDLVISTIPQAKETLHGLLAATELVETKNTKTGQPQIVKVEDKTTRLEAMRIVNTLVASLQPKTPPVAVNVKQDTQIANISSGAETTEERFRRLRAKAIEANQLPPEVAGVPEHIDAGEDADDMEDEDEYDDDE